MDLSRDTVEIHVNFLETMMSVTVNDVLESCYKHQIMNEINR